MSYRKENNIKDKIKLSIVVTIVVVVSFYFFGWIPTYQNITNDKLLSEIVETGKYVNGQFENGPVLKLELANSFSERAKGLSGRDILKNNEGLFFVFEDLDFHGIWMKDMNFPLDIIWFSNDFDVVHIEKEINPNTYPKIFKSKIPAKYVLEINSGVVDDLKIKIGDKLNLLK